MKTIYFLIFILFSPFVNYYAAAQSLLIPKEEGVFNNLKGNYFRLNLQGKLYQFSSTESEIFLNVPYIEHTATGNVADTVYGHISVPGVSGFSYRTLFGFEFQIGKGPAFDFKFSINASPVPFGMFKNWDFFHLGIRYNFPLGNSGLTERKRGGQFIVSPELSYVRRDIDIRCGDFSVGPNSKLAIANKTFDFTDATALNIVYLSFNYLARVGATIWWIPPTKNPDPNSRAYKIPRISFYAEFAYEFLFADPQRSYLMNGQERIGMFTNQYTAEWSNRTANENPYHYGGLAFSFGIKFVPFINGD